MSDLSWWFADHISLLLEPDERKAVRGDLTESGESGWQAFAALTGLVARRQAEFWRDWRPWMALAIVTPLGLRLTRESVRWAHTSAIYLWMYADN